MSHPGPDIRIYRIAHLARGTQASSARQTRQARFPHAALYQGTAESVLHSARCLQDGENHPAHPKRTGDVAGSPVPRLTACWQNWRLIQRFPNHSQYPNPLATRLHTCKWDNPRKIFPNTTSAGGIAPLLSAMPNGPQAAGVTRRAPLEVGPLEPAPGVAKIPFRSLSPRYRDCRDQRGAAGAGGTG